MGENLKSESGRSTTDVSIDIQKLALKLLSYWWLFLLCLVIAVPAGHIYLRYANYEYAAKAKLLIKGAGRGGGLSELSILSESLGISESGKDLNNEIEVLSSRPIVTKTIEKIGGDVTYSLIGKFKNTEVYTSSTFVVENYELAEEVNWAIFYIEIGYYDVFQFKNKKDGEGEEYRYGEIFENEMGKFQISLRPDAKLVPGLYQVAIRSAEDVAESYKRKLEIEVVGSQNSSSILELKLQDQSPQKAVDFINALIETYNEGEVTDENRILANTIEFVDRRIELLKDELDEVETDIENFKSKNDIITADASSSLDFALTEMRSSLRALSQFELERELLKSVYSDLDTKGNENSLIPINVAKASPTLSELINDYNQAILEQRRLRETITSSSPKLISLSAEIADIKELIKASLENLIKNLAIPIANSEKEIKQLKVDIGQVPAVEKQLLEKLRMQTIKESLFLYLLQRKEETELSMAVSSPNTRVIESAKSGRGPTYPQSKLIRLGSVLLGLFVPLIIIFIITLFENKIDSENTLASITSIPIIGRIPHIKGEERVIADNMSNSINQESFRLLRTNLNYMNLDKEKQVIMTTSSMSGEGKSIISINLALTIAQANKKVVLIDLDLRRPKVATYLKTGSSVGVSNYLAGQVDVNEIINKHKTVEDFSFITSGAQPPNPAEMLQSERMNTMLESLKEEFDYIIFDSPPMGLVADSLLLRKYVTNTLYVVRHRYTKKLMIKHLDMLYKSNELVTPSIVINDLKMSRGEYGYGGYSKAYGSGYYTKEA